MADFNQREQDVPDEERKQKGAKQLPLSVQKKGSKQIRLKSAKSGKK